MLRTIPIAENNVYVQPPRVVTLVANTPTLLFRDERRQNITGPVDEIVQRLVQNCSPDTNLYLSFNIGTDAAPICDNLESFHCILGPLQQRDISNDRGRVCCFSTGAIQVATEERLRQTNMAGQQPTAF